MERTKATKSYEKLWELLKGIYKNSIKSAWKIEIHDLL